MAQIVCTQLIINFSIIHASWPLSLPLWLIKMGYLSTGITKSTYPYFVSWACNNTFASSFKILDICLIKLITYKSGGWDYIKMQVTWLITYIHTYLIKNCGYKLKVKIQYLTLFQKQVYKLCRGINCVKSEVYAVMLQSSLFNEDLIPYVLRRIWSLCTFHVYFYRLFISFWK